MFYVQGQRVSYVSKREVSAATSTENQDDWKETTVPLDDEGNIIQQVVQLKRMDINEAHDKMGHKGEDLIKKTAKMIGCKLSGTLTSCEGCALAKAKQRAVSKTTNIKADKPGQRLFLDMSGPFTETPIGNKYMIQVVDDYLRYGIVAFCKKKSDLVHWVRKDILEKFKVLNYKIEYIRCDNAGENKEPLGELFKEFGITMELTAPDTPQQNGVVERRIAILQQQANAMLIVANFTPKAKSTL